MLQNKNLKNVNMALNKETKPEPVQEHETCKSSSAFCNKTGSPIFCKN